VALLDSPGLLLRRLVLFFWAMYFSMVAITNTIDFLGELDLFEWTFLNSQNFQYLESVVKVYDVGSLLTKLMLLGALTIEIVGAVLFWRALKAIGRGATGRRPVYEALCWGVAVWTAFVFMTEFFVAYTAEAPFRELLMIMLASAIAVTVIPDDVADRA
jgi:hypothetical protein